MFTALKTDLQLMRKRSRLFTRSQKFRYYRKSRILELKNYDIL